MEMHFATVWESIADELGDATALVHGMTVVTRDTADFEPTGVPLLNPWA